MGSKKWDFKTANDGTYNAAHSYTWDGQQGEHLNRMRIVLRFLFNDPITWQPGYDQVAGGQHRICTLRHAGATYALIVDAERRDTLDRQWQASVVTR